MCSSTRVISMPATPWAISTTIINCLSARLRTTETNTGCGHGFHFERVSLPLPAPVSGALLPDARALEVPDDRCGQLPVLCLVASGLSAAVHRPRLLELLVRPADQDPSGPGSGARSVSLAGPRCGRRPGHP